MISDMDTLGANGGKTLENVLAVSEVTTAPLAAGEMATPSCQGRPSSSLVVPCGNDLAVGEQYLTWRNPRPQIQPIRDVQAYLKSSTRVPVPLHEDNDQEKALFITLPDKVREETSALEKAVTYVQRLVKSKIKVQPACASALKVYHRYTALFHWKLGTFRAKYDLWAKRKDWTVLVNKAKAGALWQESQRGLSDEFLAAVASYCGRFRRGDAKNQALDAIKRWWRTGRNIDGEAKPIPGYSDGWSERNTEVYPPGWDYTNVMRELKARDKFNKAIEALMHEGTAAAKEYLPHMLGDRSKLRFLEEVTFDDVRTDWLIFDPETGQPCELWLLVARDSATAMVLGFVMHPSRAREDGSDSHLGLKEMKQLAAWLLERYPLPVEYICHWIVERGTATLSEGSARALQELLPNRIQVNFTSMIGGTSPVGYTEKRKGNSRGKASHESHNRLFHTQSSFVQGQTGSRWDVRPADLNARADECVEIWEMRERLPEHLRGSEKYPLLTPNQARAHLIEFCVAQNFRDKHKLQGFDEVIEWFDGTKWRAKSEWDGVTTVKWQKRMERPVERAIRLMAGFTWERISPDIIIAFLRNTERPVTILPSGEIKFRTEGRDVLFAPAPNVAVPPRGSSCLGYFNADDPQFVHVTDGRGSVLGTWYRRDRIAPRDQEALDQAFRYTATALNTAKAAAEKLAAPESAKLEAMRAHNAELARGNEFINVAQSPAATGNTLSSPVAHSLTTAQAEIKTLAKKREERVKQLSKFDGDVAELAAETAAVPGQGEDDFSAEALL